MNSIINLKNAQKETKNNQTAGGAVLQHTRLVTVSLETFLDAALFQENTWKPKIELSVALAEKSLPDPAMNSEACRILLELDVVARLPDELSESVMTRRKKEEPENPLIFILKVVQEGLFGLPSLRKEQRTLLMHTVCPETLFPYLSNRISELVLHAGYPPVYLQPMNFSDIYRQKLQQKREELKKTRDPQPENEQ